MDENVNHLLELAKLSASRHDERRKYEWKVSFAFWVLIALAISKPEYPRIHGFILIFAGLLYTFVWLRGLWVANQNDKELYDHYWQQADKVIRVENYTITDPPGTIKFWSWVFWFGFGKSWAMQFHFLVTVILLIAYHFIEPISK